MDLLFGAGIAMLIALLAWSDQINSLHKDTLDAENLMSSKRNVDWKAIKSILKNNTDTNDTFKKLKDIFDKSPSNSFQNINIVYQFRSLVRESKRLKIYYQIKYYLIILLTLSFFVGGILTAFCYESKHICILHNSFSQKILPGIYCIILSILILGFIVYLNYKEYRYRSHFINLIDQI
jgi:hypothetical protein